MKWNFMSRKFLLAIGGAVHQALSGNELYAGAIAAIYIIIEGIIDFRNKRDA